MKLFILLLGASLCILNSAAQIRKNQFLLGGNISFESNKIETKNSMNDTRDSHLFLSPDFGYFIVDKLVAGVRLDFRTYKSESPNVNSKYRSTSISPFLRYYLLKISEKINVLIDASYLSYTTKNSFSNGTPMVTKTNGYNIFAGPVIFLNPQIGLEFTVGYKHTLSDDFYGSETSMIYSGVGLQVHLGKGK